MSVSPLTILLTNTNIVTAQETIGAGWILFSEQGILAIGHHDIPVPAAHIHIDGEGGWLLPGFIDIHVHGGFGHDVMDADQEGLHAITRFHASHGTTSMLATTVTAPKEAIDLTLKQVDDYRKGRMPYAQLLGVHLEGPFISPKWPGAQNPAYIVPPQLEWLREWTSRYPDLIRMQTLAPEAPGALPYIQELVEHGIVAACGHTDALYDQVQAAVKHGLRHAVHTFNAMRGLHHREPGTVGAVLTQDLIMAEVIADGHHVHPAAIRLLVEQKGQDRVILITDAISAAGLESGDYTLGGLDIIVKDGVARLKEGSNLAGSTLTMDAALRFVVQEAGIPLPAASRMASGNPARQLGIDKVTGDIAVGKQADLVLMNQELHIRRVWIRGR